MWDSLSLRRVLSTAHQLGALKLRRVVTGLEARPAVTNQGALTVTEQQQTETETETLRVEH